MKKLIYIVASPTSMQSFILPRIAWLKKEYEVVCICSPGPEHEEARKQGLRTIELPIARRIAPWQDLKSLWALYRALRREKPDMVHSMTPKAGLLGMAAAWLTGVCVRMHTFTGLIFPWRTGLLHHILKMTDLLTCFFANVITPEDLSMKHLLEEVRITKKPLHIIANDNINGLDRRRLVPRRGRAGKRAALRYGDGNGVFSLVGRLVTDKGVPELEDCFMQLHREHPESRLLLIGREEPEVELLPDETNQQIRQHKAISCAGSQAGAVPWYAPSDIHVLPPHREGFCNSLLEAGAMELPCITYDVCACNDAVTPQCALLVPAYSKEDLYKAMRTSVEDKALDQRLGESPKTRGRAKVNGADAWEVLRMFINTY